jgi:hypothetical protein
MICFFQDFWLKFCTYFSPHACLVFCLPSSWFHPHNMWWRKRIMKLLIAYVSSSLCVSCLWVPHILIATLLWGAGLAQSVQCLTTGWTTGPSGFDPRRGQRIFLLASVSRPAPGPTQPPIQWVPGVLSPGVKRGRGVMLTTHPHLVPRSWMSRSYISSPPKRLHGV